MNELNYNLGLAVEAMRHCDQPVTAISSGCELFTRFISLTLYDKVVFPIILFVGFITGDEFIIDLAVVPKSFHINTSLSLALQFAV